MAAASHVLNKIIKKLRRKTRSWIEHGLRIRIKRKLT